MRAFVFITCYFICLNVFGQGIQGFFFDELTASVNRANVSNDNTKNGSGFGLGAYHTFGAERPVNVIFGLEYNRTSQFKESIAIGRFATENAVIYHLNSFSVPLGLRLNFGKKVKLFIEAGLFVDLIGNANKKGTRSTSLPDENNQIQTTIRKFNDHFTLNNTFGYYYAVGIHIPTPKVDFILKPDFKNGFSDLLSDQELINNYFRINLGVKLH